MQVFRSGVVSLWLLCVLGLVGCGDSRGDFVFSHSPSSSSSTEPAGPTASIELRSVLAQTVIPSEVVNLRASGYDQEQIQRYGPVTQEKASVVQWSQVPVEVTDFVIEYLDGSGQIRGVAQVQVQLSSGQTLLIDNPTILGITSSLEQLSITPTSRTIALGTSTQFTAVGSFADGSTHDLTSAVTWSAGESSVAAVNQGRAQGLAVGTTSITATFAGVSAQASLTVTSATLEALKLSPNSPAIAQGTSQAFTVEGFFSDGSSQDVTSDVEWASSNAQVASLESGIAQGLQAGQTTITATLVEVSEQTVLTVTSATLQSLSVEGGAPNLALGTSTQFSVLGTFSDGSTQDLTSGATWEVIPAERAGVNQGRVTALSSGSATVRATFAGVSAQAGFTVGSATLENLKVSPRSPAIGQGTSQAFTVEGFFSDGSFQDLTSDVEWTSSNTQVASMENGIAQGLQAGQTTITAKLGEVSDQTALTVTSATLQSLSVEGGAPSIVLGASTQYRALATFSDGSSQDLTSAVSWEVSPAARASVDQGRVTGLESGSATVRATFAGMSAQASLEVSSAVVTSVRVETVNQGGSTLALTGQTLNLRALATLSDGTEQEVSGNAVWTSDDSDIATVTSGVVTGEAPGQAFITASFGGHSGRLQITVQEAPLPDLELSGAYTFDTDSGELSPQIGDHPTPPGWNSTEERLVLRTFTLHDGATLTLTGGKTFKVKAESEIVIAGGLHFDGQAGTDGLEGAAGGVGEKGGDINLFCSGDIVVTGTITANGGQGGDGGGYSIQGNNNSNRVGAPGGRGGDSGEIILTAGDRLDLDSGQVSMQGGAGGAGGSVEIEGDNVGFFSEDSGPISITVIGGAGGKGGDGGSQGGAGGTGGDVVIQGSNNPLAFAVGGAGGDGGYGRSQDGAGGTGGAVTIHGDNGSGVTGGAGGIGGNGPLLPETGGDGGKGGDVVIVGNNSFMMPATGGAGGRGGNGQTQGGRGGNGGDVTIGSGSNIAGGAGGSGGVPGGAPGSPGAP